MWTSSARWWGGLSALLLLGLSWWALYKINISQPQKIFIVLLAVGALAHFFYFKVKDFVALLIVFLTYWAVLSEYHNDYISLIFAAGVIAVIVAFVILWQEKDRFLYPTLVRHAYLVALLCGESMLFLAYWIVYDNDLGKALIASLLYYVMVGVVDYSHSSRLTWRTLTSLTIIVLLLGALVLVTMDPVISLRVHNI